MNQFKKYIVFWLSQSVSQFGSAMTSFALILWTYGQSGSALSVSLMAFCNYVPYICASLFAGELVDRYSKKAIMLLADSVAAVCTVVVLALTLHDGLAVWNIYVVNAVIGLMNALQSPAMAVAVGRLVPKDKLANVSGMNSFSGNLISVLSPMAAAFLFAFGGLRVILLADLCSFMFAFLVLAFFISIPEDGVRQEKDKRFVGTKAGLRYLKGERGLLVIMLTMALINFFSRLTYENILSPMILARSGNDSVALGAVNAVMGIAGILGGIVVSMGKGSKNSIKLIYYSAALSFLFGDILMAVGRGSLVWMIAGAAASFPIPFIMAGQNVIMYKRVPEEIQGSVFAVRNAIQFGTIPVGILLGGLLADWYFEPMMQSDSRLSKLLSILVGRGAGSGMAVMFLCTGLAGFTVSCVSYRRKTIQQIKRELDEEKINA